MSTVARLKVKENDGDCLQAVEHVVQFDTPQEILPVFV